MCVLCARRSRCHLTPQTIQSISCVLGKLGAAPRLLPTMEPTRKGQGLHSADNSGREKKIKKRSQSNCIVLRQWAARVHIHSSASLSLAPQPAPAASFLIGSPALAVELRDCHCHRLNLSPKLQWTQSVLKGEIKEGVLDPGSQSSIF